MATRKSEPRKPAPSCKVEITGHFVDTEGQPLDGVPVGLWDGAGLAGVFYSDKGGKVDIEGDGAQALLPRTFVNDQGMYLYQGSSLLFELVSGANLLPADPFFKIGALDCLKGRKRNVNVTCCGTAVPDYPIVGLQGGAVHAIALTAADGSAPFLDDVDHVQIASNYRAKDGATYSYSGTPQVSLDTDVNIRLDSTAAKTFIEGLAIDDCGEPLAGVCVLLLDCDKVLVSGSKTETDTAGHFRSDLPGEYVVFASEHWDARKKCCQHLITDPIVKANSAANCGRRLVPTAIYSGDCCKCKSKPAVPDPVPNPDHPTRDLAPLRELQERWLKMEDAILERLKTEERGDALRQLKKTKQIVLAQQGALELQWNSDGALDKEFARGSEGILAEAVAALVPFGRGLFEGGDL